MVGKRNVTDWLMAGIAPYNGVVAVTANSRVISEEEYRADPEYRIAQAKCEMVAEICGSTAPIRIDARRATPGGPILLFDINMKPVSHVYERVSPTGQNATGPGRPGRDEQASLTTMAAAAIGWDYRELIVNILQQAPRISEVIKG